MPMDSALDDLAAGLPHSEIHGSKAARASPRLIATCYVLHRLSVPRHPPNALLALDRSKPKTSRLTTGPLKTDRQSQDPSFLASRLYSALRHILSKLQTPVATVPIVPRPLEQATPGNDRDPERPSHVRSFRSLIHNDKQQMSDDRCQMTAGFHINSF